MNQERKLKALQNEYREARSYFQNLEQTYRQRKLNLLKNYMNLKRGYIRDSVDFEKLLNEISKMKPPIKIRKGETITDVKKFVDSHKIGINGYNSDNFKDRIILAYEQRK